MNQLYYHIVSDDSLWSCADAVFVRPENTPEGVRVVDLPNLDELRVCLKFYGYPLGEMAAMDELQKEFTGAIQTHLDAFAQTRNYDDILSAATYAASTVPKFQAEGQYAVEARDATWAKGYEILGEVLAGQRPMPALEEVLAELPPLAWPG
jgi:hypothetical protein